MSLIKRQMEDEESKTSHLDKCTYCNKVLGTWKEREILVCDECFQSKLDKE